MLHVYSFSGGKDSTAMLLKALEKKNPVDLILFFDTGMEFPHLYRHIERVKNYIRRDITVVKSNDSFEYLFSEKRVNRKIGSPFANQLGYSWPSLRTRWCTEYLKNQPRRQFLRPLREKYEVIEYIGIAADETQRLTRKCNTRRNVRLPLVDDGMSESDCLDYCKAKGFTWDGLYDVFDRLSCWCCPFKSLKELRVLYKEFPALWEKLKALDNSTWRSFRADYSVEQLEKRFLFEDESVRAGAKIGTRIFYEELKKLIKCGRC